jgi:hypothetical protein
MFFVLFGFQIAVAFGSNPSLQHSPTPIHSYAKQDSVSLTANTQLEQKESKYSFLQKIMLRKAIKKLHKKLGIKETNFNENLTRIGVTIAATGLLLFFLGYIIAILAFSGAGSANITTATFVGLLVLFGFLANIVGVIIALVGIGAK